MVSKVDISFVDNEIIGATITVTADEANATTLAKENVVDGRKAIDSNLALADYYDETDPGGRARMYPGDDLFPVTERGGWFGDTLSDADGNVSGGETLTLDYGEAISVRTVRWWADDLLGVPVDFTVHYSPNGSSWTQIANVTGNSAETWEYDLGAITTIYKLKITITKVSYGYSKAKLLEFEAGFTETMTDRIASWEILQEREHDGQSLPYGNVSTNRLTLYLKNTDDKFFRDSGSEYAPYLKANRKIVVWEGVRLADGTSEFVQQGVFYSKQWSASSRDATVKVVGWDRTKRFKEMRFETSEVYESKTISQLVAILGNAFGLSAADMVIDETSEVIPYAWFEKGSYFEHLKNLAVAEGGTFYVDELNRLVFESRDHLAGKTTSVATITDGNAIIRMDEDWEQTRMRNRVVIPVRPLTKASNQQIFKLTETIDIDPGGSETLIVNFSESPCDDVQTPVITGGADIIIQSWTDYAWGGALVLQNTASVEESATQIIINGKPLEELGGVDAVYENTASIQENEERSYTLDDDAARFIQSLAVADVLKAALGASLSDPGDELEARMPGRPELQLADRVTVQHERMCIDADYWITRMRKVHDGAFRMDATLLEVV